MGLFGIVDQALSLSRPDRAGRERIRDRIARGGYRQALFGRQSYGDDDAWRGREDANQVEWGEAGTEWERYGVKRGMVAKIIPAQETMI